MSHPKRLDIFRAWAKAMELGATVDKPNYGKTHPGSKSTRRRKAGRRRKRKRPKRLKREEG